MKTADIHMSWNADYPISAGTYRKQKKPQSRLKLYNFRKLEFDVFNIVTFQFSDLIADFFFQLFEKKKAKLRIKKLGLLPEK